MEASGIDYDQSPLLNAPGLWAKLVEALEDRRKGENGEGGADSLDMSRPDSLDASWSGGPLTPAKTQEETDAERKKAAQPLGVVPFIGLESHGWILAVQYAHSRFLKLTYTVPWTVCSGSQFSFKLWTRREPGFFAAVGNQFGLTAGSMLEPSAESLPGYEIEANDAGSYKGLVSSPLVRNMLASLRGRASVHVELGPFVGSYAATSSDVERRELTVHIEGELPPTIVVRTVHQLACQILALTFDVELEEGWGMGDEPTDDGDGDDGSGADGDGDGGEGGDGAEPSGAGVSEPSGSGGGGGREGREARGSRARRG